MLSCAGIFLFNHELCIAVLVVPATVILPRAGHITMGFFSFVRSRKIDKLDQNMTFLYHWTSEYVMYMSASMVGILFHQYVFISSIRNVLTRKNKEIIAAFSLWGSWHDLDQDPAPLPVSAWARCVVLHWQLWSAPDWSLKFDVIITFTWGIWHDLDQDFAPLPVSTWARCMVLHWQLWSAPDYSLKFDVPFASNSSSAILPANRWLPVECKPHSASTLFSRRPSVNEISHARPKLSKVIFHQRNDFSLRSYDMTHRNAHHNVTSV